MSIRFGYLSSGIKGLGVNGDSKSKIRAPNISFRLSRHTNKINLDTLF
jgi:hypothetical protein